MATLTIKDLPDHKELDRKDMAAVYGGNIALWLGGTYIKATQTAGSTGQNDAKQQFQQILNDLSSL